MSYKIVVMLPYCGGAVLEYDGPFTEAQDEARALHHKVALYGGVAFATKATEVFFTPSIIVRNTMEQTTFPPFDLKLPKPKDKGEKEDDA